MNVLQASSVHLDFLFFLLSSRELAKGLQRLKVDALKSFTWFSPPDRRLFSKADLTAPPTAPGPADEPGGSTFCGTEARLMVVGCSYRHIWLVQVLGDACTTHHLHGSR